MSRLWFLLLLVFIAPAQAQQTQCLNPPVGTKSANCASQEFVTDSIAAIPAGGDVTGPGSSTAGHVATFADTTGQLIQDGGAPAAGTVTTAGNGLILSGGGSALGINAPVSAPNGGSGVVSPTAHTVPLNQGASAQTNVALSTGQVLGSDGSTDPKAISGPRILLATFTCPNISTTACGTAALTAGYPDYEIVVENLVPATNAVSCLLQIHGSSAFQAASYVASAWTWSSGGTAAVSPTNGIPCSNTTNVANSAGFGISGTFRLYGPLAGGHFSQFTGQGNYQNSGASLATGFTTGGYNTAVVPDGFQFIFSTGNISTGTVKVYGLL